MYPPSVYRQKTYRIKALCVNRENSTPPLSISLSLLSLLSLCSVTIGLWVLRADKKHDAVGCLCAQEPHAPCPRPAPRPVQPSHRGGPRAPPDPGRLRPASPPSACLASRLSRADVRLRLLFLGSATGLPRVRRRMAKGPSSEEPRDNPRPNASAAPGCQHPPSTPCPPVRHPPHALRWSPPGSCRHGACVGFD